MNKDININARIKFVKNKLNLLKRNAEGDTVAIATILNILENELQWLEQLKEYLEDKLDTLDKTFINQVTRQIDVDIISKEQIADAFLNFINDLLSETKESD